MTDETSSAQTDHSTKRHEAPLAHRAIRSGMWILGASYWTIGFGFIANIGLTRLLTPGYYGDFALAAFFFGLFNLRGKLSLHYALAQIPEEEEAAPGTYVVVDVLLAVGGLFIMLIAAPILMSLGYSSNVVALTLVMATMACFESTSSVFSAILSRQLHSRPGSTIASVALPLSYIPAFWLALTSRGQYSLIAQYVAIASLAQIGIWIYYWRTMRFGLKFDWRFRLVTARRMVVFGSLVGISSFVSIMGTQADNFLIGTLSGAEALGYYDRAYRTAQWPSLLLGALFVHSAYYTYSRLQNDSARLQKSASMVFWISANVALPVALALLISAPDLVLLLYGEQWMPAVPLLRILATVAVIRPIWDNAAILLTAIGQPERMIVVSFVQLGVLVIVGWPLTFLLGPVGTATTVVFSFVIGIAGLYILLRKSIAVNISSIFSAPLLAALITTIIYIGLIRVLDTNQADVWFRVLMKSTYAVVTFFILLFVIQPQETSRRVSYIWQMVRKDAGST